MEFWGVEVPSGKPLTCKPGSDSYVHVSQAALGENKNAKGNDRVVLKVKVGTNEVVVGTLSQGKCDQTTLDLIFEKDFVLSHNSSGSVYFCGYKTDAVRDDSSEEEDDELEMSEDDEMEALPTKENGKIGLKSDKASVPGVKLAAKAPTSKPETPAGDTKPKAKPSVPQKVKDAKEVDDDDDDDDEDEEEESDDEDDDMLGSGGDDEDIGSDDEDESDSEPESEEELKSTGKKRPAPTLQAASVGKKGKVETPVGKAEPKTPSVPSSTPKPQQSGKKDTSAKTAPGKENSNTPASGKKLGQFFCQPCNKNFNSDSALSQHKAAKHK